MTYGGVEHFPQSLQWHSRSFSHSRRASTYGPAPLSGRSRLNSLINAPTPNFRHCLRPKALGCTRAHANKTGLKISQCCVIALPPCFGGQPYSLRVIDQHGISGNISAWLIS